MKPDIKTRSWLSLVTFCAVTVLTSALGSALLFAGASAAWALARPASAEAIDTSATEASAVEAEIMQPVIVHAVALKADALQTVDDGSTDSGKTFAGMITDSRCGARHRMNSDKTSAECVRSCVRNGASYVLVDGEKIYALEGDAVQLEKLAGERVSIVGMLEGDTIKVKTVVSS